MGGLPPLPLPLGAIWRRRPAAAHALLSLAIPKGSGSTGAGEHDAAASFVLSGALSAGAAAGARRTRAGIAGSQGGPVGNENRQDRRAAAGNDGAALYR